MRAHTAEYLIDHKLSSSAKSVLYTAFHNNDLVVIKSPKLLNATENEFMNHNLISHPCIIPLLGAFGTDLGPSLVLPYAAGDDLLNVTMADPGLDEQSIKVIAQRVLIALKQIHSLGMMHQDVKPENIFLMEAGSPNSAVLADLEAMGLIDAGLNPRNVFPGTSWYAAPEIWKQQPYDEKIDLWALGVTLYVAAVRLFPFTAPPGSPEMMEEIQKGIPKYQSTSGFQRASGEFRELIAALLAVNPAERPSAEDALRFPWFADLPRWDQKGEGLTDVGEEMVLGDAAGKWEIRETEPMEIVDERAT
jgi:serine/threonine protein kinase